MTYEEDAGEPEASLLEIKLLINIVISDTKKGARFCTYDIKDLFLASPMDCKEYRRIQWEYIPYKNLTCYNIETIVEDDG